MVSHNKLKLEIGDDGMHTNEDLYRTTGFSWNTPARIISAFYNAQMNMVQTCKEKGTYEFSKSSSKHKIITSI